MLTKSAIQVLIVKRLMTVCHSCNSSFADHVDGQIRALLAVLNDGKNIDAGGDCRMILDAAGIPWRPHHEDENGWAVDDEWLIKRGCKVSKGRVEHPKLKEWE